MNINKHYIRLKDNLYIIHGFSDAFESPVIGDICINQEGQRHFELNGIINPTLIENSVPKYKYVSNKVYELTQSEKDQYKASLPLPPKSQIEILQETVDQLVIDSLGGM